MGTVCPPPPCPPPPPPPPPSPPAEPHLVATPPGALAGSVWVEGTEFHYIASNGQEWAATGTAGPAAPGAAPGSFWVDGENFYYIDASGSRRVLQATSLGAKAAPAIQGSLWVDSAPSAGKQFQWIGAATRWQFWNGF